MTITIQCRVCGADREVSVREISPASPASWGYHGGSPAEPAEYEVLGLEAPCACGADLDTPSDYARATDAAEQSQRDFGC